ncbi:uncharacterized protein LOC134072633 isoform X2 [Sardina pilchardus]|uniref:uncharacterized protein LOC134072633 isoform X2 n=1 Tax=Sardina pilchardus TaxID=27697 RepID=UPI002E11746C
MARYVWVHEETNHFLELIRDRGITNILDSKQQRNASIYKDLEAAMNVAGFRKPWQILRSKWKTLKQKYLAERRKLSKSGAGGKDRICFKYFSIMEEILGQRPIVTSMSKVVNSIDEEEEEDVDPDDRPTPRAKDASIDSSSFDDEPTIDAETNMDAEAPVTPNIVVEEERPALTAQHRWRTSRSRRPSLQSVVREQAREDNAVLNTISQVMSRAIQCFERATEAAERHATALEALAGIQQPNTSHTHHQPPYSLQHPTTNHPQPPFTSYSQPQHYHHTRPLHPPYHRQQAGYESEPWSAVSSPSTSSTYHML